MPVAAAYQLRIALALVLLEHKPAHLSLHDYLEKLRSEVRRRTGRAEPAVPPVQEAAKPGGHRSTGRELTRRGRAEEWLEQDEGEGEDDAEGETDKEVEAPEAAPLDQPAFSPGAVPASFPVPPPSFSAAEAAAAPSFDLPTLPFPPLSSALPLPFPPPQLPFPPSSFPAAPYAPVAPLPAAALLQLIGTARAQLNPLVSPAEGEDVDEPTLAATLASVGPLLEWVCERAGELPNKEEQDEEGRSAKRKKRNHDGAAGQEMGREKLSTLLINLLPSLLPHPSTLPSFASLLSRFTSSLPSAAIYSLLPSLLSELHSRLSALLSDSPPSAAEQAPLEALLSLLHLFFSSLPSSLPLLSPSPPVEALVQEVERLTLLLTTPEADALYAKDEELEARVLGAMEGCWALREVLEVAVGG
ncbi:hypothetical protein JCM10213v2_007774 [Rhodosporidiobolus nylandii]